MTAVGRWKGPPRGINAKERRFALSDINNDGHDGPHCCFYTSSPSVWALIPVYLHAYNLNVPYGPRTGALEHLQRTAILRWYADTTVCFSTAAQNSPLIEMGLSNQYHSETLLSFSWNDLRKLHPSDVRRKPREQLLLTRYWAAYPQQVRIPLNNLPPVYWISVRNGDKLLEGHRY